MLLKTNKQLKIIFIGSLIQAAIVVFNSIFSKNSIMATVKDISDVYYIWY
jgi:hypothetical protein